MQLSRHFSLDELLVSETAYRLDIDMTPSPAVVEHLAALCEFVLEPLRARAGVPIVVSSGYRPPALNRAIGGSATSAHMTGDAADIRGLGMSVYELAEHAEALRAQAPLDQVILEFGRWVHVGTAAEPRGEILTARRLGGATVYELGLVQYA